MRYYDLAYDRHVDTRSAEEIKEDIKKKLRGMRDGSF
jgi:hypothetical protein